MSRYRSVIAGVVLLMSTTIVGQGVSERRISLNGAEKAEDRLAWFRAARFGMFVHWGLYAVPAGSWKGRTDYGEWIMLQAGIPAEVYARFADKFNPIKFDARTWVSIAKTAGMKYVVVTAKHHDGFSMYETGVSEYNIVKATPFKRDPLKELAQACRETGLKFCVYYSIPDWYHPDFPARYSQRGFHGGPRANADLNRYLEYLKAQVRELLTNYGPIGILWFDGGGSFRDTGNRSELIRADEIIKMVRGLQPDCLVNNRLGVQADYGTPEQTIPGEAPSSDFEVCMTLNRHWGYNANDREWKSPIQVIRNLADIASKGGNYLLNVGPDANGIIPAESAEILREVGRWLAANGESIYGSSPNPLTIQPSWGRITRKGSRLYAHIFDWPEDGRLKIAGLQGEPGKIYLLADSSRAPLRIETSSDGQIVYLPQTAPDSANTVVVIERR